MGKKIFVSYKYADQDVEPLKDPYSEFCEPTTARNYIDELQKLLSEDDHINKGELDGQDLSQFTDETIASHLRDKIYDSSITIVAISPNMKDLSKPESEQWIPWEISYSLKEHTRSGRTSRTNGVIALVLPDRNGSYNHFITDRSCCDDRCRIIQTFSTFQIIRDNMFNLIDKEVKQCATGETIYYGENSYIIQVKWCDFKKSPNRYLSRAELINDNIDNYKITKTITQ
ncbi:hypothetical protein FOC33_15505 [Plesiomonas shigelloides]|uniref:TIR domain-containing protein n=1 Tax=Plesiomonas shigelloides TaxID=703 RepID=UPI00143ED8D6|nr:TIR domain-containing protein [Plesiomonas shigelloides]QIY10186.1 hypothetical protein FOC33_15505 [Plesiomonas shigelloides]